MRIMFILGGRPSSFQRHVFIIILLKNIIMSSLGYTCLKQSEYCNLQLKKESISTELKANRFGKFSIRIGGLFELGSNRHYYAHSELSASMVALKHVNENKALGNYHLEIIQNDTKVSLFPLKFKKK